MTGQEEVVVVALQAGRLNTDFQNIIGNFAMEVAYQTSLTGNPSFAEISERVTNTMNEAHSHQPVPLDWVRKALADDGISFNAPGISILTGSSDEKQDDFRPRSIKIEPPGVRHGCHGFPVSCAMEFIDRETVIEGSMVYRTDVYDEETINKFLDIFKEVVVEAIKEPGKRLGEFV
jgi:non-ribosomal peptide synthetase component F